MQRRAANSASRLNIARSMRWPMAPAHPRAQAGPPAGRHAAFRLAVRWQRTGADASTPAAGAPYNSASARQKSAFSGATDMSDGFNAVLANTSTASSGARALRAIVGGGLLGGFFDITFA